MTRFKDLSIRGRLFLSILPLIVIATLGLTSVATYLSKVILLEMQKKGIQDTVVKTQIELNAWLSDRERDISILAQQPEVIRALEEHSSKHVSSFLSAYHGLSPFYENVFISDARGVVIADSIGGKTIGLNLHQANATISIEKAMERKIWLGKVIASPITKRPVALLSAPVMRNDQVIGIVGLPIELNEFSKIFVNQTTIGKTGHITIIEASGVVIAHFNPELILKTKIADQAWAKNLITDLSGDIHYEFGGVEKIGYFIRANRSDWVVLGSLPAIEAYEGVIRLQRPLWILSFVIFGLIFGLLYLVSNQTLKNMQKVITVLSGASQEIGVASKDAANTNQDLMQQNTTQASALTQTAESVEEVNSIILMNSEKAKNTTEMCTQSQGIAQSGKKAMDVMIREIENVNQSYREVLNQLSEDNQQMNGVLNMIHEIGQKTKIINDIVFQTRLLSFNASVEAARAGENGKGFAVVAEEVGNLAQLSGKAAKEISDMLENNTQMVETMQKQSKAKAEALIEEGKKKVEASIQIAQKCGANLEEIVQSISSISGTIENMAVSYQEQVRGIEQINQAMKLLSTSTNENANTSKKASDISVQLSGNVSSLNEVLQLLVRDVQGAA